MRSKVLEKILKETPLEVRLKTSNEMAFIELLTELGFRENKMWSDDEDEMLQKLCDFAKKHTEHQLARMNHFGLKSKVSKVGLKVLFLEIN